jgi:hypothetical protein
MTKHIVKSIFFLIVVAFAQIIPFSVPAHSPADVLTETKLEQTERLFSACIAADAEFCFVKSKPRVEHNSDSNENTCEQWCHDPAIAIIRAAANLSTQSSQQSSRSLWLIYCALLI